MKRHLVVPAVAFALVLCTSALADEVELVTGEKLTGTILSRDGTCVVLDHPVLGKLTIPNAQVKPPAPPPPPWKFKVEFGGAGSTGNVEQSALHAAISAVLDDDARRFKAEAGYFYAQTEGDKTQDQGFVELTHDWKIAGSKWSPFATARYDHDEFQDWNDRAAFGVGIGYALYDEPTYKLRLRAGLNELREWGGSDDGWRLEGLLGAEGSWTINDTNSIEAKVTYYPDLQDGGEYRLVGSAAWSIKLAKDSSLSLKLGVEDEYDSHKPRPFEKNDFRWFAALLYEF